MSKSNVIIFIYALLRLDAEKFALGMLKMPISVEFHPL